jgi:hypothetical protein
VTANGCGAFWGDENVPKLGNDGGCTSKIKLYN